MRRSWSRHLFASIPKWHRLSSGIPKWQMKKDKEGFSDFRSNMQNSGRCKAPDAWHHPCASASSTCTPRCSPSTEVCLPRMPDTRGSDRCPRCCPDPDLSDERGPGLFLRSGAPHPPGGGSSPAASWDSASSPFPSFRTHPRSTHLNNFT